MCVEVSFESTLLALVAVLTAEFLIFDKIGSHRYTTIYPRWNDQVQYLSESYTAYEYAQHHGLPRGVWQASVGPSAQGMLFRPLAVIAFSLAGASRSAALALNMFALLAWQAALFLAVVRSTGSRSLACAGAMLPLCLRWPWNNWAGSTADFVSIILQCARSVSPLRLPS